MKPTALRSMEKSEGSRSDGRVRMVPPAAAWGGRLWPEWLLGGALPKAMDGGHGVPGRGQMLSRGTDVRGKRLWLP